MTPSGCSLLGEGVTSPDPHPCQTARRLVTPLVSYALVSRVTKLDCFSVPL